MAIPRFFMDTFPVTNDQYHAWLTASAFRPADVTGWLGAAIWPCSDGSIIVLTCCRRRQRSPLGLEPSGSGGWCDRARYPAAA